mgnify:CR=1 FL=1
MTFYKPKSATDIIVGGKRKRPQSLAGSAASKRRCFDAIPCFLGAEFPVGLLQRPNGTYVLCTACDVLCAYGLLSGLGAEPVPLGLPFDGDPAGI